MPNPFECPGCHARLAYSAALRGRTVRCHHCGHSFPVAELLEDIVIPEPAVVGDAAPELNLFPPPLPRLLIPPPLPVRASRSRQETMVDAGEAAGAETRGRNLDGEPGAENAVVALAPNDPKERPPAAGPVIGMIGVLLFSGLVMASGIGYLIWPGSSRQTAPAIPVAAPPIETPVDVEQPKSLREVLEGGGGELPKGPPKPKPGAPGPAPNSPQRK